MTPIERAQHKMDHAIFEAHQITLIYEAGIRRMTRRHRLELIIAMTVFFWLGLAIGLGIRK